MTNAALFHERYDLVQGNYLMIHLAMCINKIELISRRACQLDQRNKKSDNNSRTNDTFHQFVAPA